jgi:hypothetical protein
MAIDGTYGFVYCGSNGLGVGVFCVHGDRFEGMDYAGGRYEGTAVEDQHGNIHLRLTFEGPAGGMGLVEGTTPQDAPLRREIRQMMPRDFGDGRPIEIISRSRTVTVMVKRIPNEFAPAATQGLSIQIAQRLSTPAALGAQAPAHSSNPSRNSADEMIVCCMSRGHR